MKRLLWLAAALVALASFPATAGAADVTGVAVAKNPARKTIVVASRTGALKTIRVRKQFGKIRVGQRFAARGRLRADGTLAASAVKPLGLSNKVRFRAVVVKLERNAGRLLLSGGRSVFSIRLRPAQRATASDGGGLQPGDKVVCGATVEGGTLAAEEKSVSEVGHTDRLELQGIYLYETDGGFDIAVVHRGLVHVQVPDGLNLPKIERGDEVALVVTVENNGSFTLVKLGVEGDHEGDQPTVKAEIWVEGVISELRVDGVSVKPDGDRLIVKCALPEGKSLAGFAVADRVKLHCRLDGGRSLIAELKSDKAFIGGDSASELYAYGAITELGSNFVRIQPDGDHPSIRCDFAEGLDVSGFAAGDRVKLHCLARSGKNVLVELRSEHADVVVKQ